MGPAKFFRKYSRVLVLTFMSLLLVVFLIEPVLTYARRTEHHDRVLGEAFGQRLSVSQVNEAGNEMRVAGMFGFNVQPLLIGADDLDANLHAYLLVEEARRMGITVAHSDVQELLRQRQIGDEMLDAVRKRTGRSLSSIYDCIGRYIAALQAFEHQAYGVAQSLPRAEEVYQAQLQHADVRLSVLDARAFMSRVPEPSEQELSEYFEAAKNRRTQHSDDRLEFGYHMMNRARIEYLTIDPAKLEGRVVASLRESAAYFERHKDFYIRTLLGPQAATQPASSITFESLPQAARDRIREDRTKVKLGEEAQRLMNDVHDYADRAWRDQPRDEQGYRQPPPAEQTLSFKDVREHFAAQTPIEYGETDLIELRMLQSMPGLGTASYLVGRQTMSVWMLTARTKGLYQPERNETMPLLVVGEPGPVMVDHRPDPTDPRQRIPYQAYVFRVVEIVPEGPPRSIEEVRGRLVAEWRLTRAFELARAAAEKLAEQARGVGLEAAVQQSVELLATLEAAEPARLGTKLHSDWPEPLIKPYREALGPFAEKAFSRVTTVLQELNIPVERLPEAVFGLSYTTGDSQPAHRVVVQAAPRSFNWVVAELVQVDPIYRGEFEARLPQLLTAAEQRGMEELYRGWFNPQNVKLRAGLKRTDQNGQ
ncbi:MAG: hypothetical protein LC135_06410 [Phycisphaerae bacterium]|nr:hypothetical protein [Phycisphaerae bacterium]MCZ2399489.1 hypothetical protein [Phycisphaerae bacterium]NUQ49587.1 hypothetical protein [Phycisphaerae bacterium]